MSARHPSTAGLLRWFEFGHLSPHLQAVSQPIHHLAHEMADRLPDGPELSAGLRKLLEAKDCLVRAAIDATPARPPMPEGPPPGPPNPPRAANDWPVG